MTSDLKAIRFIQGTKISHDYKDDNVTTFSYRELVGRKIDCIGIPAKQNGLIIIDVDVAGASHKHDGREWWFNFVKDSGIVTPTYTVRSPSGGYHFYYRVPTYVNLATFSPPNQLAPGVDVKYNGWVGAPPSPGYGIDFGTIEDIQEAPDALMNYIADRMNSRPVKTFDSPAFIDVHRPFTDKQLDDIEVKIKWMQDNATLSYSEWRDGLFALKVGVLDPERLDRLVEIWTYNKSYRSGDEHTAKSIVEKASVSGGIGPGTLLNIIQNHMRSTQVVTNETPFTVQEIFDKSGVEIGFDKSGAVNVFPSETNACLLVGAMFDLKQLYHDSRQDLYIFRGRPASEVDIANVVVPMVQSHISGLGLQKFKRGIITAGIEVLMAQRKVDPHQEYLKSLEWDGISRIETFFTRYANVEDRDYVRLVSKKFWLSLAARGMEPGCKSDWMLVLEGAEGVHKSSLFDVIAGKYVYACNDKKAFDNIDCTREMHQSVIVELPELVGLINQPGETVKAFLSKSSDMIRDLFAKKAVRNERSFVMVGTTNSKRWLTRSAGVRRFYPIRIPSGHIDIAGIRFDRDQLFAEAVALYKQGELWWDLPLSILEGEVAERLITEPLVAPIKSMMYRFGTGWTTAEVFKELESNGFIGRGLTNAVVERIEGALEKAGAIAITDPQRGIVWCTPAPVEPAATSIVNAFDFI